MKFNPATVQCHFASPLGTMVLAASPQGLAGVWFEGQQHLPPTVAAWPPQPDHPLLMETARQLSCYFAGEQARFDLPLDLSGGTAFQQAVWRALLAIARGSTSSYGAISQSIGHPGAVRAAGGAIGRNPISIIVPCHRVIGSTGALTGYAGGLARKTALLELEGALETSRRTSGNPRKPGA